MNYAFTVLDTCSPSNLETVAVDYLAQIEIQYALDMLSDKVEDRTSKYYR